MQVIDKSSGREKWKPLKTIDIINTERSPNLQTILMVEEFIDDHSGEFKKTELFKKLPKKMMWGTFQKVIQYLEKNYKIIIEKDGRVTYIWNPKLVEKYMKRDDLTWRHK
jgi:hypothetical protein